MKSSLGWVFGLLLMGSVPALSAPAGGGRVAAAPPQIQYEALGISIDKQLIRPGEALPVVFGVAGPPDQVRALRGKSKKEQDDYVMFSYYSQGFSLDIDSKENRIIGILIQEREVKVPGIPFSLGADQGAVLAAWGEPDRTDKGAMAYWRRGVYVGVDAAKKVVYLFLTAPGSVEDTKEPAKSAQG